MKSLNIWYIQIIRREILSSWICLDSHNSKILYIASKYDYCQKMNESMNQKMNESIFSTENKKDNRQLTLHLSCHAAICFGRIV